MKESVVIFVTLLISILAINVQAQQNNVQKVRDSVIPLVQYLDFLDDESDSFPQNPYFKDIDNDLDKFIGIWKGIYGGKEFEIHIAKYHNHYAPISIDELELTYKITKTSDNTVVASTLNINRTSPYNVVGEFLSRDKTFYSLYYIGYESKCGQNAYISLRSPNSTGTILNLKYTVHGEKDINGCAQTATHIFPTTQDLILSKQ